MTDVNLEENSSKSDPDVNSSLYSLFMLLDESQHSSSLSAEERETFSNIEKLLLTQTQDDGEKMSLMFSACEQCENVVNSQKQTSDSERENFDKYKHILNILKEELKRLEQSWQTRKRNVYDTITSMGFPICKSELHARGPERVSVIVFPLLDSDNDVLPEIVEDYLCDLFGSSRFTGENSVHVILIEDKTQFNIV